MSQVQNDPNFVQPATVGRVVWVWLGDDADVNDFNIGDSKQAFRADIVFVYEDGTINVAGKDHSGEEFFFDNVALENYNDDSHHEEGMLFTYATWMPYQKQQHDKQALEQQTAQGVPLAFIIPSEPATLGTATGTHAPTETFRTTEGRVEASRPSEVLKPGETAETPEAQGTGTEVPPLTDGRDV